MGIKSALKHMLPARVQDLCVRSRVRKIQSQYQSLGLADVFTKIYESGAWGVGAADGMPHSGSGSRGRYVEQWCSLLETQLRVYKVTTIADLGCGDLTVGAIIARMGHALTGVDVVQSVIDWNRRTHTSECVRFVRADLTSDPLPHASAAIVRQVLQHLTNSEVDAALANILRTYPLAFITEHVYTGPNCVANVDMHHGPGTRVSMFSGVFIDHHPFNVPAKCLRDIAVGPKEALRTWVVESRSRYSQVIAGLPRGGTRANA